MPYVSDDTRTELATRDRVVATSIAALTSSCASLLKQLQHPPLRGDEGVDSCGLAVEVVGDRPLLVERRGADTWMSEASSAIDPRRTNDARLGRAIRVARATSWPTISDERSAGTGLGSRVRTQHEVVGADDARRVANADRSLEARACRLSTRSPGSQTW